uniref:Uncharacterized protein n=1 Tax=Anopheles merus TaxID=30066 RepID=A0A182VG01_ANOME
MGSSKTKQNKNERNPQPKCFSHNRLSTGELVVPAYRLESRSFSHPFFVRDRRSSRKGLGKKGGEAFAHMLEGCIRVHLSYGGCIVAVYLKFPLLSPIAQLHLNRPRPRAEFP